MEHAYNIALVGAGQLGSRHLQGLKKSNMQITVFVVDPSQQSLDTAKERYEQIAGNPLIDSVSYFTDIADLPVDLDIAVVATSSIPRASIIKKLLASKKVHFLILEKVLFPSLQEYSDIAAALEQNQVKAWVNCVRRMYDFYKELKILIADKNYVKFKVSGSNWGMACNTIHFLDLYVMLSGEIRFTINTSALIPEIVESKRAGYVEFNGTITGKNGMNEFSISSNVEPAPFKIEIETDRYYITINESAEIMEIKDLSNGIITVKDIKVPYQSELTHIAVEQILNDNKSDLTPFMESKEIHLQFLTPIVDFYNRVTGGTGNLCPIT